VNFAPDGASIYYSRNNKQEHCSIGTFWHAAIEGRADIRQEFRGEELPATIFAQACDRRFPLPGCDHRTRCAGTARDIVYRDLTKPGSPLKFCLGIDSRFETIYAHGAWYVKTITNPQSRILKADPGIMPEVWKTIVPEGPDAIDDWSIVGGKIYVNRLKDAKTETAVYTLDGKAAARSTTTHRIVLRGCGRTTDRYGFFSFQSFIVPPAIYRIDTLTGKRDVFFHEKPPLTPANMS